MIVLLELKLNLTFLLPAIVLKFLLERKLRRLYSSVHWNPFCSLWVKNETIHFFFPEKKNQMWAAGPLKQLIIQFLE